MTKQTKTPLHYQEIEQKFDQLHDRKLHKWMGSKSATQDQPAFDEYVKAKLIHEECYTKTQSDLRYQKAGSAPSPSGGGASIDIPVENDPLDSGVIQGAFTVNIIDYDNLSKYNTIGVGGITSASDTRQRLLYTHGKQSLGNSKHYAGFQLGEHAGFTGIKKLKDIHLDWHWHKQPPDPEHIGRKNEGRFDIGIQFDGTQSSSSFQCKIDTTEAVTGSKKVTGSSIVDYGYYRIGLGAISGDNPDEYALHVQAFYSNDDTFKPKGLKRDFQFKKYNNIDLLATYTEQDIYTRGKIFDKITKKLNIVNLRDLKIHRGILPHSILHQDIIAIEVPDDALVPTETLHPTPEEGKRIGERILVNNLSEISATDEAKHRDSDVPYFVQDVVNITLPPDEKGKRKTKWCWLIVMDLDKVYKFEDLLAQTQIIYPLKKELAKEYQIPSGGYVLNLTNGSKIQSNLYSKVTGTTDDCYLFSKSPFGFDDIKVPKHQIVSVTPNI